MVANDPLGSMERINHYLKRAKELLDLNLQGTDEFKTLVGAIREESMFLTPDQRHYAIERFFDLWHRPKN